MESSQLRAFVQVAEHLSFSLAANALHLTQPAISNRITNLETQLGQSLFDRLPGAIALTPAGNTLLPVARRAVDELENCARALAGVGNAVDGPLALGVSHHIGLRHLPPLLRRYIGSYPAVEIQMQLLDSEDALAQVLTNRLEMALITLPTTPPPGAITEVIWHDPLRFACAPDHPLASATSVDSAALAQHTALLPTRETVTRRLLESELATQGVRLDKVMETNYLETNKVLAEAGLGWTLLPERMLDRKLYALALPGIAFERALGVVLREGRSRSKACQALIELLRTAN